MRQQTTAPEALNRIRVVLAGTKEPGNIGSVARAMKNMGLSRLYLVDPPDHTCGDARKMAHGSGEVLYGATVCESLEEALSGTVLSVGTTHRKREHLDVMYGPRHVAEKLVSLPRDKEAALVFGREENGLTNNELALCSLIANIPTAHRYPSLNLSQAVLIFGYELYRAAAKPGEHPELDLPTFEEMESLYAHVDSALDKLGFPADYMPKAFPRSIRRLFGRISMDRRDVATMHRIFRQIDKFVAVHKSDAESG